MIGATPTFSLMLSFRILSHLVLPHIQRNILSLMKDINKQTKKCKIENMRQISVKRKIEKQYDNGKC